eukprot:scaffold321656_cov31-Tisochrysis_lutea.AAC.4
MGSLVCLGSRRCEENDESFRWHTLTSPIARPKARQPSSESHAVSSFPPRVIGASPPTFAAVSRASDQYMDTPHGAASSQRKPTAPQSHNTTAKTPSRRRLFMGAFSSAGASKDL